MGTRPTAPRLSRDLRFRFMHAGAYVLGLARLAVVGSALAFGAWSLRRRFVAAWRGAPARLAEIAIAVVTAVLVCEVVGAFGWFRRWPVLVGIVVASLAMAAVSRGSGRSSPVTTQRVQTRERPAEVVAATAGVAVVGAQWCGKIAFAYRHGMTHPDTVWYHATYAAKFVQQGHLLGQLDRTDPLHAYAGQTSELLHAQLIVATGRDAVSPLVNLAWAGLALLAAWCIGRRHGFGALCVLGATVALGLPTILATHPGQASDDVLAATFVLVAVALLLEGELAPVPTAIAALVAGLAFSTKVTAAAPVAVLTIGVIVVAIARRRVPVAIVWCVSLLCTGSYWIARNLIVAHNPLPYYTINVGFLTFTRAPQRHADAVAKYLFNSGAWRGFYLPGLRVALGDLWPFVLAISFATSITVAVRRNPTLLRIVAMAGLAAFVAYLFTPYSSDFGLAFTYNVRYAEPALLLMLTIAPIALIGGHVWLRLVLATAFVIVIVVDALTANHERLPAWPHDGRGFAVVAAILIIGVVVAYAVGHTRVRAMMAVALAIASVVGYPTQRYYTRHRYIAAGLPADPVDAWLQPLRGVLIAFFGTDESYPFYGAALTNHVERPAGPAQSASRDDCRTWIRTLARYQYIVIAHEPFVFEGPVESTIADDHSVRKVAGNGTANLYEVMSRLSANAC